MIELQPCDCMFFFMQSAVGSDYVANVEKHSSQTDAAKGFGGKYGVQKDRQDKVWTILVKTLASIYLDSLTKWIHNSKTSPSTCIKALDQAILDNLLDTFLGEKL